MTAMRDPECTRARILSAAIAEFSCFGNKEDLFRQILRRKTARRVEWLAAAPATRGGGTRNARDAREVNA